ncbi:MAG: hypothetical protein ACI8XV_000726 [Arenicella sp.]
MSSIFISHSSKDNDMARELERELAKQNHTSVFLDIDPDKGIVSGQSWERTLYRKLRACRAVIAICTDDYLGSRWCFAEIALARMEGKPIFALKVDGLSPDAQLPSILGENQYIKMQGDTAEGYRRLWNGLREIDLLGVAGDWNPNESPYLGLAAFHEKHAPIFFGREQESHAGVELLKRGSPSLIMTIGGSGSGKSSLVRAGILPRLRQTPDQWLIIEPFRPGLDPFLELADAIVRSYQRYAPDKTDHIGNANELAQRLALSAGHGDVDDAVAEETQALTDDERVQRLLSQLEELHMQPPSNAHGQFLKFLDWSLDDLKRICESPVAGQGFTLNISSSILVEIADDLRRVSGRPHARVLLVIDQFEEMLSHKEDREYLHKFLRLIRDSIEMENSPLMVLATMRSDFLSQFQHNNELRGIDFETLSLGPMQIDGIRRVIEEPAKLGAITLEEGLADRLIQDTGSPTALPLLSFTLWKLWRDYREDGIIDIREYEDLGGLEGAVAKEAQGLLKPAEEEALRKVFLRMVRLTDEGVYARRPLAFDSKMVKPVQETLEKFVERRLLSIVDQGGEKMLEVSHESLFSVWAPLRQWLDENRAELVLKREITREANSWERNGKSKDNLWRGSRLSQAKKVVKRNSLEGTEKSFVQAGNRRRWRWRFAYIALGLLAMVYMVEQAYQVQRARDEAVEATEYLIATLATIWHKFLPEGSQPGTIQIDESIFDIDEEPKLEYLLAKGYLGKGRVMAIAHGSALAGETLETQSFLRSILGWGYLGYEQNPKLLYSTGHCEVISDSENLRFRLPFNSLSEWKYEVEGISDLSKVDRLSLSHMLIIGNAWGAFSTEEITAVKAFVTNGGSLFLAGIKWSWNGYKHSGSSFNPCSFTSHSKNMKVDTQRYPMNELGKQLGIQWVN